MYTLSTHQINHINDGYMLIFLLKPSLHFVKLLQLLANTLLNIKPETLFSNIRIKSVYIARFHFTEKSTRMVKYLLLKMRKT